MKKDPNWFLAMVEFRWTVREIARTFSVCRAIAQHIQSGFGSYDESLRIAEASRELTSQVGH